jgi:hypothetical protein
MNGEVCDGSFSLAVDFSPGSIKKPYANIFPSILTYERRPGKSVPAPGSWFGLAPKAAKVAYS